MHAHTQKKRTHLCTIKYLNLTGIYENVWLVNYVLKISLTQTITHQRTWWIWQETLFYFHSYNFWHGNKAGLKAPKQAWPTLPTDLFIMLVIKNQNSVYTYKHTYIYTYTHTHTRAYTYTYKNLHILESAFDFPHPSLSLSFLMFFLVS